MNNPKYEYYDEASIYPDLMCVICSEPFKDPVCTPCDHTFCRVCIRQWIEREDWSCPICRTGLVTIQLKQANRIIFEMLNRILVKCIACGKTGLQRGKFDNHLKNECPASDINCSASSSNCPWTGKRDELSNHLKTCIYHAFQPFLNQISIKNEQIKQDISTVKQTNDENYFNQTSYLEQLREECETSTDDIDANLRWNEQQIEDHEYQLVDYPIQIMNCFDRINKSEIESSQINNMIIQSNQNDINIKQLTIKLNLLKELYNDYQNPVLEECINKRESNSWIDLSRQQLTNRDMEIVVTHALINKQCKELDLRRNEISSDGIAILTDHLTNNNTLQILYLSHNLISDLGVYYLVEAISLNNTNLQKLELDSNDITDQGANYLADMLKINQTIKWLSLDNNNIANQGIQLIAEVLSNSNQELEELYINGNKLINDQCTNSLLTMIKQNQTMRKFSLENCGLSKRGKARLQRTTRYKTNFSLCV